MCGVAFDGFYEVGYEVEATLVLHFHFRPCRVDFLFESHEPVVGAASSAEDYGQQHRYDAYAEKFLVHNIIVVES